MTRIGGVCLVTIGIWVIIELSVQFGEPSKGRLFGHHGHTCGIGVGAGSRRQTRMYPMGGFCVVKICDMHRCHALPACEEPCKDCPRVLAYESRK